MSDQLRLAGSADLAELLALEQRCFATDRMSSRQMRHHLRCASSRILVVQEGEQLVAALLLMLRSQSKDARIYSLAVDPHARGRGLGARLVKAAERLAAELGARRIRLEVRQDNQQASRLYASLGYQRLAELAVYYEDGAAGWRLQRQLDAT